MLKRLFSPRPSIRRYQSSAYVSPVAACVSERELEKRLCLSGFGVVYSDYVPAAEVGVADQVVLSQDHLWSTRGVTAGNVSFNAKPGTDLGDLNKFTLSADLFDSRGRFRQDGVYETVLDTTEPIGNHLRFDLGWAGRLTSYRGGIDLQVTATVSDDASSQLVGLSQADVDFESFHRRFPFSHYSCGWWGGGWGGGVRTYGFGAENPTHEIVAEEPAELFVGIEGPASQVFTPYQNDVTLANINFETSEAIQVGVLPILIEGDISGDDVRNVVEDVELRNVVTGRTVDATVDPAGSFGDSQVYLVSDFVVRDSSTWEIRVDITNGSDGDAVRASILDGYAFEGGAYYAIDAMQLDGGGEVDTFPGGRISGNKHRIVEPSLTMVQSTLVSSDTVVENQRDVTLLRYETHASEAADILITGTAFQVEVGSGYDMQNYSWWVDTDANGRVDTILESGVSADSNGVVTFADPVGSGYVNPAEQVIVHEVHADAASSFLEQKFSLGFADNPIEVETLDDGGVVTDITTVPSQSTVFTLVDQGDLYVTKSTVPVRPQYLLGGALTDPVLRLDLHAENEAIDVTYVGLDVDGSSGSSIDRFELFLEGESTPFGFVTRGGAQNGDMFGGNFQSRQLVVAEGQDHDVIARARVKSDAQGGLSGQTIIVSVGSVEARGDVSSNDLLPNDGDSTPEGEVFVGVNVPGPDQEIVGSQHMVVMSRINSVSNANPDPNGASIPIGTSPIGQFKFTAAAHSNFNNGSNDAVLDTLTFTFAAVNIEFDPAGFRLYNKANATVAETDYVLSQVDADTWRIVFEDLAASPVNTEIDEGDDVTLALAADITDPWVDPTKSAHAQVFSELDEIDWLDQDAFGSKSFNGLLLPETRVRSTAYRN